MEEGEHRVLIAAQGTGGGYSRCSTVQISAREEVIIVDHEDDYEYYDYDEDVELDLMFADPGGNSALRAATPDNPRNLPCPTCGEENRLTPADKRRGYQCDACANQLEMGF